MNPFAFARITAASPRTHLADPAANAEEIARVLESARDSDVVLFPELAITGYTCADLFGQTRLLDAAEEATAQVAGATRGRPQLVVIGVPARVESSLYNCAAVLAGGRLMALVPKQFIPTYKEFYERRWFRPASGHEPTETAFAGTTVPFGVDLLFEAPGGLVVGVEVCEDLWMPVPPSSSQAMGGANVLLNLSASNELIGKSDYRHQLVVGQSGRCIAAYAYASSGPTESTTDLVFGGHCLIAENGHLLAESARVGDGGPIPLDSHFVTQDVDLERLMNDRRSMTTFDDDPRHQLTYRRIPFAVSNHMDGLKRVVDGRPFVPREGAELHRRCAEIFGIQCAGLARRMGQLGPDSTLNIGISGGLDSTLALLVAVKACDLLGWPRTRIHGLTMPGFGTSQRTRTNALALMELLGIAAETTDIRPLALEAFRELKHEPFGIATQDVDVEQFQAALAHVPKAKRHDLVFENVQARLRTFLLMSRGFVVGTGDMSEAALGWSTYNADHMSMYNPNCSIPKTLVKFLVEYVAKHEFEAGPVRDTLLSIAETTISPELLPLAAEGAIEQSTEATLGPYELHDFFLFNVVRCGYAPDKVRFLAGHATFSRRFASDEIDRALRIFYERFFRNQFKRSCVPDGPKVGSVSLSPRGDWRMPSDADPSAWLGW